METRLKHLSQKFSALDDVGIMDDESDWDELSLDVNMVDSSVLLETSSCVSMSTEENEEVSDISNDDMDKVDKSFIEKLEVRALMALPIHDFIKMKPIQSIIDSHTQPQLVDMARRLLELDKFQVQQHRITTYRITYSHPSSEVKDAIQRHFVKEPPCPVDEVVTSIPTLDCIDNNLRKKNKAQLKQLLEEALNDSHTAKLYTLLEERIRALPEETRRQILAEAHWILDYLEWRDLWKP